MDKKLTYCDEYGRYHASTGPTPVINKLACYEEMEEQNRVVILPFSPDTEIYLLDVNCLKEPKFKECSFQCKSCEDMERIISAYTPKAQKNVMAIMDLLNKGVYLKREDAEKRLEELNNEDRKRNMKNGHQHQVGND